MKQIDRIRNMNAEELASLLQKANECSYTTCDGCPFFTMATKPPTCYCNNFKAWLESEVTDDDRT